MPRLELIVGPKNSGKTDELIRRLTAAKKNNQRIMILRPNIKKTAGVIKLEKCLALPAIPISSRADGCILVRKSKVDFVGIDECHHFGSWLFDMMNCFLENNPKNKPNLTIIAAGQYLDKGGNPYCTIRKIVTITVNVLLKTTPS